MTDIAKKTPLMWIKEHLGYAGRSISYFCRNDNHIIIAFLIPFFTLLISYFLFGVWPFGQESVLSLDLNGQYVYYYDHMYDVLSGEESVFYSWSRNLSGEFMGIIGYYLGSPFNFIVWLFPRSCITEGLLAMLVTKVGAISLCMALFLTYGRKLSKLTVIIFSTAYALCSYTIVQTMNPMWLDGVLILPFICWGIESFIKKGKFRLMLFSWIYGFVTCFYIGYMLAIFSVVYFFYCVAAFADIKVLCNLHKKFIGMAVFGITAALCSAFMLLPVYESLKLGKLEFSTPDYSLVENFSLIDLCNKLLPNSYDTVRMEGLPFIYCGIITVLMLPAYFFMKKINGKERISSAVLLVGMVIFMYIRPIDMLWHGGQMPNWLPYRYSFIVSFLFCLFAATAFNRIKEIPKKTLGVTAVVWFFIMMYQESIDHFNANLGSKGRDVLDNFTVILPAMGILILISAVVIQCRDKFNMNFSRNRSRVCSVALLVILCGEMFFNTLAQIDKQDTDIVYSNRDGYVDVIGPTRDVVNEIKAQDDGFYRIEKLYFRTVNDPLALNMYGISHSSSTLNAAPIEFLSRLGFTSRSHYTRYSGATLISSSLLGVKYELTTDVNSTDDVKHGGEIYVTENDCALPLVYLVDNDVLDYELPEDDPFAAQSGMLSAMLGESADASYFERIYDVEMTPENVTQGSTTDGHHSFKVIVSGNNAQLEYTIPIAHTGGLYMYLPTVYERCVNLWVNKVQQGTYFESDNLYLKRLGDFTEGESVDVILTLTKNELYFKEAQFAWLDEARAREALTTLKERNINTVVEQVSSTKLKITTDSAEAQTLLATIPDEKGWTVTVDGVKTEYQVAMGALIAIPLTAGAHTVEMTFTTASYPAALLITLAGIIIVIIAIILWCRKNKKDREERRERRRFICSGEAMKELKARKKSEIKEMRAQRRKGAKKEKPAEMGIPSVEGMEVAESEALPTHPDSIPPVNESIAEDDITELNDWESLPSENEDEADEIAADDENFYEGLGEDGEN